MADELHVTMLKMGASTWNQWQKAADVYRPDLVSLSPVIDGLGQRSDQAARWSG